MKKNYLRWIVISIIIVCVYLFFAFDLQQYLTLEYLKSQQAQFQQFYQDNTVVTIFSYVLFYVAITALSLPGAAIMTLAGGALFGFWVGTIAVSFASTIGATLAFLVARFLLHDFIQKKYGDKLKAVNDGIKREGAFYLFTLRLIPAFPFFIINLVMGLTPIRTKQFFFVSQIGMLPGTMVFVNAGTQLSQIDSLKGILSPSLLLSFVLLGIFPLLSKKALTFLQKRRGFSS